MILATPQFRLLIDALKDPMRLESISTADEVFERLLQALREVRWTDPDGERQYWQGREGGVGQAMAHLFARLAELTFNRLNHVPDKVFLDFLTQAGIDRLAPKAARLDATLSPAPDLEGFIRVPAATQLATVKSEALPEIIFETERDLVVTANGLQRCIGLDRLRIGDYTAKATGNAGTTFPAFQGETERRRAFHVADSAALSFEDEALRQASAVTLDFTLLKPGDPDADGGWEISWIYWDGSKWSDLQANGATLTNDTKGFRQSGQVTFRDLPALAETALGSLSGAWIGCELRGGTHRDHLPIMGSLTIERATTLSPTWAAPDAAFTSVQSGAAFLPLDTTGEFYPLGQRPQRLDALYLQADEVFSKAGASVEIGLDLVGIEGVPTNPAQLDALTVEWDYHSTGGWVRLGTSTRAQVTPGRLNFDDTSFAFTASGNQDDGTRRIIGFDVPDQDGANAEFAETTVNEQKGLWVRARIVAGSYDEPGECAPDNQGVQVWTPPKTHAPFVRRVQIRYSGYSVAPVASKTPQHAVSVVDDMQQDHSPVLSAKRAFAPFEGVEEDPALYLGFKQAFPQDEWSQLLIDARALESSDEFTPIAGWEYWNGAWEGLRTSDGTRGLTQRGYVGFFAPRDHITHGLFGHTAYWVRLSPYSPPRADAGKWQQVVASAEERARVILDGSQSQAMVGLSISRYHWRLTSSTALPAADAGQHRVTHTDEETAQTTLDASGSKAGAGRVLEHYRWRRLVKRDAPLPIAHAGEDTVRRTSGESVHVTLNAAGSLPINDSVDFQISKYQWRGLAAQPAQAGPSPVLKALHLNTVPAVNGETLREEILGSSDDTGDQVFQLLRPPVSPSAVITVREPDQPPTEELDDLRRELRTQDPHAEALLIVGEEETEGVWVRWHQVASFHGSEASNRHYILDPISGTVRFGDGRRGKIPPRGSDNVKAVLYRTHASSQGNVDVGKLAVLRNPSGELANIKTVTNMEAAAGGSEAETLDRVRDRGPQMLKHRERAVTWEDYQWLALEATGEISTARCLPTRDRQGLPQPGWVTVVITPESPDPRPTPSASLIRLVQDHLQARALANLTPDAAGVSHIYVKGPEYIEVAVQIEVVPVQPEKADEVELAVLERLAVFLHPLDGGPRREGWALGRDVYLSEVYHEVESVQGVDHASRGRLYTSLQQYYLEFARPITVPFATPSGSQVGSFDERIRLRLADALFPPEPDSGVQVPDRIGVYGFKVGDKVDLVEADGTTLVKDLEIAALEQPRVSFGQAFAKPTGWERRDALSSKDGRIRLPLAPGGEVLRADDKVAGLILQMINAGDEVCIIAGTRRDPELEFLEVRQVMVCVERVFVPEGHLIYSGSHDVQMSLG